MSRTSRPGSLERREMAAGAGRLREQSRRLFAGYATMAIAVVATFTAIASGGTGKGACRRGHQARGPATADVPAPGPAAATVPAWPAVRLAGGGRQRAAWCLAGTPVSAGNRGLEAPARFEAAHTAPEVVGLQYA